MKILQLTEKEIDEIFEESNREKLGRYYLVKEALLIANERIQEKLNFKIKKEVHDDWIRRLSSASQEDAIFPLAGQDFRNKVIEFIKEEKSHLSTFVSKSGIIADKSKSAKLDNTKNIVAD